MQYQNEIPPALPNKINIRNPKMNVRLVIESWDTSPELQTLDANTSAQVQ
jgi:hypothetical protein